MPSPRAGAATRGYGGVGDIPIGIDENSQPGTPSNITGTVPGGYDPAHGGVPLIPDPTASAWQAIGGDLSTLPQAFTLGNAYNLFNFGQQQQTLQGTPSYQNVLDLMGGKLPQDVINQIAQQAAERGVEGGHPNDPNANAAYLRALGLNSLQAQQTGQNQYGALAGHYPMAAPFNLMDFLVTGEQQQAANAAANTNAAAPNPAQAAAAEQAALLQAIAAGKGSVGGAGAGATIPPIVSPGGLGGGGSAGPGTVVGNSLATGLTTGINPNGTTSTPPIPPGGTRTSGYGPVVNPGTGSISGGYLSSLLNDPSLSLFGGGYTAPSNVVGSGPVNSVDRGTGGGAGNALDYWNQMMNHLNSTDFGSGSNAAALGGGYLGNIGNLGGFGSIGDIGNSGSSDIPPWALLPGETPDTGTSTGDINHWWTDPNPLSTLGLESGGGYLGNLLGGGLGLFGGGQGVEGTGFTNPGNLIGYDPTLTASDPYPYEDIFG